MTGQKIIDGLNEAVGREAERAAVVEWLRAQATCGCNRKYGWCNADSPPLMYADAIEAGKHLKREIKP